MAKGKSFLGLKKGQAGGLVYSIGRDGKGKRQQVIRALAEQVANPQTYGQALRRSLLGGASRVAAYFARISDHAYEGIPAGQANRSAFISAIIQMEGNGTQPYSVNGIDGFFCTGVRAVPISKGTLPEISSTLPTGNTGTAITQFTESQLAQYGLEKGDILTFVHEPAVYRPTGAVRGQAKYTQVVVQTDGPLVNSEDGTAVTLTVAKDATSSQLCIKLGTWAIGAVIHERKANGVYKRSSASITISADPTASAGGYGNPQGAAESYMKSKSAAVIVRGADYLDGSDVTYEKGDGE